MFEKRLKDIFKLKIKINSIRRLMLRKTKITDWRSYKNRKVNVAQEINSPKLEGTSVSCWPLNNSAVPCKTRFYDKKTWWEQKFKEVQYFKHHKLKVARVVLNYDDIKA